ncbi:MAG: hypothetical protein AB3N14_00705 [Flavobacteriaceae bacterium]
MKMMNDLDKKKANDFHGYHKPEKLPHDLDKRSTSELFYKKLTSHLLLLYQCYLKGETILEPEIKMAIWRMMKFDEKFPIKIRMVQQDYLNADVLDLEAEWDDVKEVLFPKDPLKLEKPLNKKQKEIIREYKDTVNELLAAYP